MYFKRSFCHTFTIKILSNEETHIKTPYIAQQYRSETEKNILDDLFCSQIDAI